MSSSKTNEIKDHGIVKYTEPTPKPARWMPRALRELKLVEHNIPHDVAARKYGHYPMVANRTIFLSGHRIEAGERFTTTGNAAHELFFNHDGEFVSDGRREKELAVEKAVAELKMPLNLQNEPAYANPAASEFPDAVAPAKRKGHVLG